MASVSLGVDTPPPRRFLGRRSSGGETSIQDLYETPSDATEALLDFLCLREGSTVFEPCCGNSAISNVLIERGLFVIERDLFTMDREGNHVPNPENARIGHDFLVDDPPPEFDCIITNPPYCSVLLLLI
jgi:tRNA1(Val) A37 N6-methylase TrmN6